MAAEVESEMTIDQLAQRSGMTVRNIRAHQSRGLLPPPEVRARTGYYGQEHVERLELIRELQDEGFNLEAIRHFLQDSPRIRETLRFKRAVTAPFEAERPEMIERAELGERLGPELDDKALRRAEDLGLVVALGGGSFEVPSPTLLRAAEQAVALGVPLRATLDVLKELNRSVDGVARSFVRLYLEGVWKPFEEQGRPDAEWPRVRDSIEALRPLAADTLLAAFGPTMTRAVEEAFGKQLRRGR